jgi:hypothetical protein
MATAFDQSPGERQAELAATAASEIKFWAANEALPLLDLDGINPLYECCRVI